tara:strand:- start:862 stop:1074 length:213 start_codon:yes stop_codon:yes gene_type:complete
MLFNKKMKLKKFVSIKREISPVRFQSHTPENRAVSQAGRTPRFQLNDLSWKIACRVFGGSEKICCRVFAN